MYRICVSYRRWHRFILSMLVSSCIFFESGLILGRDHDAIMKAAQYFCLWTSTAPASPVRLIDGLCLSMTQRGGE